MFGLTKGNEWVFIGRLFIGGGVALGGGYLSFPWLWKPEFTQLAHRFMMAETFWVDDFKYIILDSPRVNWIHQGWTETFRIWVVVLNIFYFHRENWGNDQKFD